MNKVKTTMYRVIISLITLCLLGTGTAFADSPAAIPDPGFSLPATISEMTTTLAITVSAAIGACFGWTLLKRGVQWAKFSMDDKGSGPSRKSYSMEESAARDRRYAKLYSRDECTERNDLDWAFIQDYEENGNTY